MSQAIQEAIANCEDPEQRKGLVRLFGETQLRKRMLGCEGCRLHEKRTQCIPWSGSFPSDLVMVVTGPGDDQDEAGNLFPPDDKATLILDECLETVGLRRSEIPLWSVVACKLPGNRAPRKDEIEACAPHFKQCLALSQPKVILALGSSAAKWFMPGMSLAELRSTVCAWSPPWGGDECLVIATFHPGFLVRQKKKREEFLDDLLRAAMCVKMAQGFPGSCLVEHVSKEVNAAVEYRRWRKAKLTEIAWEAWGDDGKGLEMIQRLIAKNAQHPYAIRLFEELARYKPKARRAWITKVMEGKLDG